MLRRSEMVSIYKETRMFKFNRLMNEKNQFAWSLAMLPLVIAALTDSIVNGSINGLGTIIDVWALRAIAYILVLIFWYLDMRKNDLFDNKILFIGLVSPVIYLFFRTRRLKDHFIVVLVAMFFSLQYTQYELFYNLIF
jgi:hypothetical protein